MNLNLTDNLRSIAILRFPHSCLLLVITVFFSITANDLEVMAQETQIDWDFLAPGIDYHHYKIPSSEFALVSNVVLVKFDPRKVQIKVSSVQDLETGNTSARRIAQLTKALVAINGSFFDRSGKPLGVIISNKRQLGQLHRGGSVLTGVFFYNNTGLSIVQRDTFDVKSAEEAIQAGPRLLTGGQPLKLLSPHAVSRRSGIALLDDGSGLLYATEHRLPGASLYQIQQMLLDKRLGVREALNLDGGGSSQIFIRSSGTLKSDLDYSGGDNVPVALTLHPLDLND